MHFSSYGTNNSQIGQTAPNQPAGECNVFRCMFQELCTVREAGEEAKVVVLQNVHPLMVRPQIVNFFAINQCPEVRANEFHRVQFVLEPWPVAGQPLDGPVPRRIANVLEIGQVIFLKRIKR